MTELNRELLADIIRLFEAEGLLELVVEEPGLRIAVRKETEEAGPQTSAPAADTSGSRGVAEDIAVSEEPQDTEEVAIASPIAGVFYRAPSPGVRPYVNDGDEVEEGQIVGIVEAMKVMNEITSHVNGVITRIVAQNEDVVAVGEVLMWVRPL